MLFFFINFFDRLLQFQGMADQAAERAGQLIQRRLVNLFMLYASENGLGAIQHFNVQVERKAVTLALEPKTILEPQLSFRQEPVVERSTRNIQILADPGQISILIINQVQRVDFGFEGITSRHLRRPFVRQLARK